MTPWGGGGLFNIRSYWLAQNAPSLDSKIKISKSPYRMINSDTFRISSRRCRDTSRIQNTRGLYRVMYCMSRKRRGGKLRTGRDKPLGKYFYLSQLGTWYLIDILIKESLFCSFQKWDRRNALRGGSVWWWKVVVFSLWKSWYFFVLFATENKVSKHFAQNVMLYVLLFLTLS